MDPEKNRFFLSGQEAIKRNGSKGLEFKWVADSKLLIICKSVHILKYDNAASTGESYMDNPVGIRLVIDNYGA